jgi:hypothetical protein
VDDSLMRQISWHGNDRLRNGDPAHLLDDLSTALLQSRSRLIGDDGSEASTVGQAGVCGVDDRVNRYPKQVVHADLKGLVAGVGYGKRLLCCGCRHKIFSFF